MGLETIYFHLRLVRKWSLCKIPVSLGDRLIQPVKCNVMSTLQCLQWTIPMLCNLFSCVLKFSQTSTASSRTGSIDFLGAGVCGSSLAHLYLSLNQTHWTGSNANRSSGFHFVPCLGQHWQHYSRHHRGSHSPCGLLSALVISLCVWILRKWDFVQGQWRQQDGKPIFWFILHL